jgi:hypothetical protein
MGFVFPVTNGPDLCGLAYLQGFGLYKMCAHDCKVPVFERIQLNMRVTSIQMQLAIGIRKKILRRH